MITNPASVVDAAVITPGDPGAALPSDLAAALAALSPRAKKPIVRSLLLRLCAWQPMRAEQLAKLTKRNQDHLVRTYLTAMVDEGELAYGYPEMPTHPFQTYHAVAMQTDRQVK